MGSRSENAEPYTNPCLTMYQPWASFLIQGIKRVEGRSWPAPITGRLWIHAASKEPEPDVIKAMEDMYQRIYALDGITDVKFPQHYPVGRLLGCVEVVGCIKRAELLCWEEVPKGVRHEAQTDFCWLCEQPKRLVVPLEMRARKGVYNLERKLLDPALRGLFPVTPQFPVKFPLPDPQDPESLKPGSLLARKPPPSNAADASGSKEGSVLACTPKPSNPADAPVFKKGSVLSRTAPSNIAGASVRKESCS